jgi:voltage-dependent potassium channel beta subunit
MPEPTSGPAWPASSFDPERAVQYRLLGTSGLRVSALAFGSWVTVADQVPTSTVRQCLSVARESGITLFDTAETYAGGRAEAVLGQAFEDLGWERSSYVLVTKLYWGLHDWPHLRTTLNRKYLLQGIDGCLERLRTPFVDLLLCHRRDSDTSVADIVWSMSDIVGSGRALYWGTSEWPAADVRAAVEYAERYRLRRPVAEQPEYNLFARQRVEREYPALVSDLGLGLMTWSPLASGLLTGKYRTGVPPESRAALPNYGWLQRGLLDTDRNRRVRELSVLAQELGCSVAQLAIAWCLANPSVASVILGASGPDQLRHDIQALDFATEITVEVGARIDEILA